MFHLKTPSTIAPQTTTIPTGHVGFDESIENRGEYRTLDEAIEAAMKADLDLSTAIIEKNGGQHTVNDWISFRIAGGNCSVG